VKHNRIIALIVLVFVAWWGYLTTKLPETTMLGEPGPKFFPTVILVLMAFFSVILFFNSRKETGRRNKAPDTAADNVNKDEVFPMSSAIKLFGVFFLGIILVYFLGFNIGMIIGLCTMLWMIGWEVFPRAILFSTSVTLAVYFLFDWLMKIPLPTGILF